MPRKRSAETTPVLHRIAPDLLVEDFGEKALIFLARRERFITVNKAAARLVELTRDTFAGRDFTLDELVLLLNDTYVLTPTKARREARNICTFSLHHEIMTAGGHANEYRSSR